MHGGRALTRLAPRAELEARPGVAAEWAGRMSDRGWVKAALEVMKKVKAQKDVVKFFDKPVSASVTDYHALIFHPVDLAALDASLRDGRLGSPDEWAAAVRTMFRNAFVYNRPSDPFGAMVLRAAEAGSATFEKEMMRLRGIVIL